MREVNFTLDKSSKTPLYIQLYMKFKDDIVTGKIKDNERLPSRRRLSANLGLSKNTVELAYQKLMDAGYAVARSRSGYYARQTSPINKDISEPDFYSTPGIKYVMSHNGVDLNLIPRSSVNKLYRDITYDMPELLEFGHKYGEKDFRQAIVHNLYELHDISCTADRVIVGAGTEFLLEQLTHIFDDKTVFGFENPCFARSYIPIKNSGKPTKLIDIPIDSFPVEALENSDINVMYLSPDMQFPTARRLSKKLRGEILDWANKSSDRYIIEADFDLDFSDKENSKPLFAMDNSEKVIFLGTFCRSVAPSFKTAFLILPKKLKDKFDECLPYYMCLEAGIQQQVAAKYIRSGKYAAHVERLRNIYSIKRQCLVNEIQSPYIKIYGVNSGTYLIASVSNGMTEEELKKSAAEHGVKLIALSACLIKHTNLLPENSFILGFGELSVDEIVAAAQNLNTAWKLK